MNRKIFYLFVFILFLSTVTDGKCESMEDLINRFGQDYESLKPEKNSSVHTDYKLEQAALGTFYTTKALNLIYEQNQDLISKYDQMAEKYNEIVGQNREIIRLLAIIAGKGDNESDTNKEKSDK